MVKIGLFRKVLSITLWTLLLLLLAGWLITRGLVLEHVKQQISSNHRTELYKLASFTEQWQNTNRSLLEFTASMPAVQTMNPQRLTPIIEQLNSYLPLSLHTMMLDKDGIRRAQSATHEPATIDYSDRKYFQQLKNQDLNATQALIIGSPPKKPMFVQAVKITDTQDHFQGVLVNGTDLEKLSAQSQALYTLSRLQYLLLDADAHVIAASPGYAGTITQLTLNMINAEPCADTTAEQAPVDMSAHEPLFGKPVVLSSCRLYNGWQIVITEDHQQAYAEIARLDKFSLVFLLLTILVGLASSWVISRLVIRRLNQIGEEVIQAVQQGTLVQIDGQRTDDEFAHFRQRVSIAMHGQVLINQLLQQAYNTTSVIDFIHAALNILNAAPWIKKADEIKIYVSLKDNPDLFYSASLSPAGLMAEERYFDTLPPPVRECIATNSLITRPIANHSVAYMFPIYLSNISGGCLSLTASEHVPLSDPEAHFIVTYLDVLANIINHLSTRIALQQQEQLTTQLIDNSDLAISVRSLSGEISVFNRGFETLFDLHREDYVKLHLSSLSKSQQARICFKDKQVIENAETVSFDEHYEQSDGRTISFQTVKFPITDAQQHILGIGTVSTNITSRLQMEERLHDAYLNLENQVMARTKELHQSNSSLEQQKRALETLVEKLDEAQSQLLQSEKLASIGQLAAGVAHEINNPVGFVNSNLGSLRMNVADLMSLIDRFDSYLAELPDSARADIESAKNKIDFDFLETDITQLIEESIEGVGRVRKIVADLKSFSRIDSGKWEQADIHQCLESTINVVWNEIKYKAELKKEYAELPDITCYPSQLNQVIMNLLVNAVQAIPDFGEICISTGCNDQRIWIEIADNGKGIPEAIQKRIFDPFFTTKDVGKGTGLGLSVSYNIIKAHHGSLSVRSVVNEGSVFRIELPITQPDSSDSAEALTPGATTL